MVTGRPWTLWTGVVVASLSAGRISAQDSLSFSTVELAAGVAAVSLPSSLSAHWRASPALLFSAATPYGKGALRVSLEASRQSSRAPDLPDYLTLFSSVEWGLERRLLGPVHARAGAGLGGLWLHFDDVSNPSELELGLTATLQLRSEVGRGVSVGVGTSVRRILFADPVTQRTAFVQVGVSRALFPSARRVLAGTPSASAAPPSMELIGDTATSSAARPGSLAERPGGRGDRLTAVELRTRGVQRLPEILEALGWDRTTVDHRTFWATPDGLGAPPTSNPHTFVDNVPVALPDVGGITLDLLPLALSELEGVRAFSTPGSFAGRFVDRGSLALSTSSPESDGFGVFTSVLAENSTGDPGPLLYTDSSGANVDKIGTGYEVGARWRVGRFTGSTGLRYNSDLVTDHRLSGRTLSLRDPRITYPVMRTHVPWLGLRFDGESAVHDVRAGRATRSDYRFLPALGFEVPTETALTHVGGAGRMRGPLGTTWAYAAHVSWSELSAAPNDLGLALDLSTRRGGAHAEIIAGSERRRVSVVVGVESTRSTSPLLPSPVRYAIPRVALGATIGVRESDVGFDAELRSVERRVGSRWHSWGETPFAGGAVLRWELWHLRAAPGEREGFWRLHDEGYRFLERGDVEVRVEPIRPPRETGAQLRLMEARVASSLWITPFARVSRPDGVLVERFSFAPGERRPVQRDPVVVRTAGPGTVLSAGAEVHWKPRASVIVDARYRWSKVVSGDSLLRAVWESHPTHRLTGWSSWSPRADLLIGLGLDASNASRWHGFEGLGVDRLPGGVRLDAWVEKTLWGGRAKVEGRLRNLLDREIPLHPLGAAPGLSLALGATARVGR